MHHYFNGGGGGGTVIGKSPGPSAYAGTAGLVSVFVLYSSAVQENKEALRSTIAPIKSNFFMILDLKN